MIKKNIKEISLHIKNIIDQIEKLKEKNNNTISIPIPSSDT